MKKHNKAYLLIVIGIISISGLLFSACSAQNTELEDKKWLLNSYGTQDNMQEILENTVINLTFDSNESKINGSSGCNTYFAKYDIAGNNLSVTELAYTEMACISPEGVMEQEQTYLSTLAGAQSFELEGRTLIIACSGGQQLKFATAE